MIEREKRLNIVTGMATLIAVLALLERDVDYIRGLFFFIAGLAGNQIGMAYHMNKERKKEKLDLRDGLGKREELTKIIRVVSSLILVCFAFYEMFSEVYYTNYILVSIVVVQLIAAIDSRERASKTESKTALFNAVIVSIIAIIIQFI